MLWRSTISRTPKRQVPERLRVLHRQVDFLVGNRPSVHRRFLLPPSENPS